MAASYAKTRDWPAEFDIRIIRPEASRSARDHAPFALSKAKEFERQFASLLDEAQQLLVENLGLLTNRERDCLRLAAQGLCTKSIAEQLVIAEPTVNFHLQNAAVKLRARGRTQAVARAVRMGAI